MRHALRQIALSGSLTIVAACHGGDDSSPASNGPISNAGPDVRVDEKSVVQLVGSGSSSNEPVTFAWTQLSGQTIVLSNSAIANPTFVMPTIPIGVTSPIELRLTVTDSVGAMASDTILITGFSSDYVVYVGEERATGLTGLYTFDAETGLQRSLAGPFTAEVLSGVSVAPNGLRVLYRRSPFTTFQIPPQPVTGTADLYSVRADGTDTAKLNSPGTGARWFSWSPDSSRIVYQEELPGAGLVSVLPDGTGRAQLSDKVYGPQPDYVWAPDGSRLVFVELDIASGREQLSIAKADGTERGALGAAHYVRLPTSTTGRTGWSPDGRWLAYEVTEQLGGAWLLYTVRPYAQHDAQIGYTTRWEWSPTGSYLAAHMAGYLYAMRPDGSELVNLTKPVAFRESFAWAWAPDGSRMAFRLNQDFAEYDLYSVHPNGAGLVRLNPSTGVSAFDWSPDSSRIAYVGAQTAGGPLELFTVLPDGSGHVRLNRDLPPGGGVVAWRWSPDSKRVLFVAEQTIDNVHELFSVRPDGAELVTLSGPVTGGTVPAGGPSFTGVLDPGDWAPNLSRILYTTLTAQGRTEVYTVLRDGTGRVRIDDVGSLEGTPWSPDGSRILYQSSAGFRVAQPDSAGGVMVDAARVVTSPQWAH